MWSSLIWRYAGALRGFEFRFDCRRLLSSPHSFRAAKDGFHKIATAIEYPDVPGTAIVVRADRIKKQPEQIKRFIRASLRAMAYIPENRSDATQMIAREFGRDQEITALSYNQLLKLLSPDGKHRMDRLQLIVGQATCARLVKSNLYLCALNCLNRLSDLKLRS